MKHLLLSLIGGALPFFAAAETITIDIPDEASFGNWTVIDANNDGGDNQWKYDDADAIYKENRSRSADDWLISPAVTLKGGTTYKVSSYLYNATTFSSDKQKFTINAGTAPEVAALETEIYKNESLSRGSFYNNYDGYFTPDTDGEYYFAIHCYSASYNGDFKFQKFVLEAQVSHPGAVTSLTATAADLGALQATLAWTWPTVSDLGGAYTGSMGAYVYRNTSSTFSGDLSSLLVGTVENGEAGQEGSFTDADVPQSGNYYYQVVTFNAEGSSTSTPAKTSAIWIGKDTGVGNVSNIVATVVDDHTVSLTFDPPTGTNGGYIDLADVAYTIQRKAGSGSYVTLEEAYTGALPYVDSNVYGLNVYTYQVGTVYNGQPSSSWSLPKSNEVKLGGALDVPYYQDFSTSNDFFSFFHGENATRDWSVSSNRLQYWGNPADAYAVTPGINLEAGKAYELSFTTRISTTTSGSDKPLYVRMGKEATAEGLSTQLFYEVIQSTFSATKTIRLSVPENGKYYIAFHCLGTVNSNDIYVDDIKLVEIPVAPLPAENFAAVAGEKGALHVALSWTNPTDDNTGGQLAEITKAVVKRGNTEVATVTENLVPGQESTFVDNTIQEPGKYNYTLTLYLGENASESVTASTEWVGTDTPKPLENATAVVNDETSTVTITWDALTDTGVNGGYVETDKVTYTVTRRPDGKTVVTESALLTADDDATDASLGMYWYEITVDQYPTMAASTTDKVILGDAIEVTEENPYRPDFSNGDTFEMWTLTPGESGDGLWKYNESAKTLETGFIYNQPYAFTPPLKMAAGKYKVVYKATCYSARYTSDIEIYLSGAPTHEAELHNMIHSAKVESVSWPSAVEVEFEITQSGTYHIGYRDVTADHWKLALSQADVEVVELYKEEEVGTPEPVADLTVTPGEKGELTAQLSWTNPALFTDGSDLTAITSVVISRNDEVVATLTDDLVPGESAVYTDNTIEEAAFYTYSVTVNVAESASEATVANPVWVGPDTPMPVTNASAIFDEATGNVTITWDAPAETGVNGGYVDVESLTYKVVRTPDQAVIAEETDDTTVDDTTVDAAALGTYGYEISIVAYPEVAPAVIESVSGANSKPLPYVPDFSTADFMDEWTFDTSDGSNNRWRYSTGSTPYMYTFYENTFAITPDLSVLEGTIELVMTVSGGDSRNSETLSVYLLPTTPTDNGQSAKRRLIGADNLEGNLIHEVQFNGKASRTETVTAKISATGKYNVAFSGTPSYISDGVKLYSLEVNQKEVTTGVENVGADDGMVITTGYGSLTVLNATQGTAVYTVDGRIAAICDEGDNTFSLTGGVYIVKGLNKSVKVIVK